MAHLYVGKPPLPNPVQQLDLLLAEHNLLVIVLVVNGAPLFGEVVFGQQGVQPVLLGLA